MAGEATKAISKEVLWGGGHRSPFSVSYGKMMMWFFLISDALTFGGLLTSLGFYKSKYGDLWPISENVFYHFPFVSHDTHLPLLYVALMTFILIVSSVTMVLAVEAGHRMNKKKVIFWLALTVVGGLFFVLSQVWEWSGYIKGTEHGAMQLYGNELAAFELPDGSPANLPQGTVAQWKAAADGHGVDHSTLVLPVRNPLSENSKDFVEVSGAQLEALLVGAQEVYGANLSRNEYGHQLYADFFFFITGFHGFHVFSGVVINLIILIMVAKNMMHERGHYEMVEKTGLYWHFVDLVWVFVFTFYYLI